MSRRILRSVHRWVGLAASLLLIAVAVSGSALVFENEIDRALNPALYYVTPGAQTLPVETLVARVQAAVPADRPTGGRVAEKPGLAYEVGLMSGRLATIDPYTGIVRGVRNREGSF